MSLSIPMIECQIFFIFILDTQKVQGVLNKKFSIFFLISFNNNHTYKKKLYSISILCSEPERLPRIIVKLI